jgi:hypothetical protein
MCLILFLFLGSIFFVVESKAGVSVNVGINVPPPPVYAIPAPPPVVVIPGTYVYFAPGFDIDIFFYHGYWYRPHGERWYRAVSYNGPWAFIAPQHVPQAFYNLPPDYRHVPPGHQHIPYGQVKKNWRKWEQDRHWDRPEGRSDYGRPDRREGGRGPEREWDRGPGGDHDRGRHGGR